MVSTEKYGDVVSDGANATGSGKSEHDEQGDEIFADTKFSPSLVDSAHTYHW